MSGGARLVVITSADSQETTASLVESLSAWCAAGMLAEVVWLPADELADRRAEAQCRYYADGASHKSSLGESLSRYHRREVWLAALRHPRGPGRSPSPKEARRTEEGARESLAAMLGSSIEFRSLTVQVAAAGRTVDHSDCTPAWDFHLIHDSDVEAHESLSRMTAADREPLGLCAMVALCASGGWRDAERTLAIEPDRFDGVLKLVRFVHCQMRVLHTPPVPLSDMQTSPPWPLPQTTGVERAQPDAVPPLSLVAYLAREGRFLCARPPSASESSRWSETLRLLRSSVRGIDPQPSKIRSEAALERLADRTGQLTKDAAGGARLDLDNALELPSLVLHIERSDFLSGARVVHSFVAERNPWSMVRETMFGLVDGAALPGGVAHPTRTYGDVEKRLLWTDPLGIAQQHAPRDARDILSADDPNTRRSRGQLKQTPTIAEAPEPEHAGQSESDSDPDEKRAVIEDGTETSPSQATAEAEQTEQPVVFRDALMDRLAEAIAKGLREAQQGFRQNCGTVSVQRPYENAVAARRKALWPVLLTLLGLIFVAAFAIDRRWRYMADVWEYVTPFDAVPYGPAVWPLIGITLTVALVLSIVRVSRLHKKLLILEQAKAERQRLSEHCAHYASELLRLYGVAQQFFDHRSIITEFLHRPFGHYGDQRSSTLSVADLTFASPPPHSMLVAYAEADPKRLDARHHNQQESAVEPGWLSDVYESAYSVWSERYRSRVLGEFQDPDHDTTAGQTVVHRNRRDGSALYGARTDFAQSVVADSNTDESGWAIRQAATARAISIGGTDSLIDNYLALFGPVESVHGWQPGVSAADFFGFADRHHEFAWDDLLRPGVNRPAENPHRQSEQHFLDAPQDRSLVVAWRLEVSGPVRPQDQAGWQGIAGDNPTGPSPASSRPVV